MDHDPHGILAPGNVGPFASVCETCGCRKAGALGHGPPCRCGASHPSAYEVLQATLAGVDPAKLKSEPPSLARSTKLEERKAYCAKYGHADCGSCPMCHFCDTILNGGQGAC